MSVQESNVIVDIQDLKKFFFIQKGGFFGGKACVQAIRGVSLQIFEGETLGLVGESGSGKSTLGRLLLKLWEPTEGSIRYRGIDLKTLSRRQMRKVRSKIQVIFQDPYASLNPRMSVENILMEPFIVHRMYRSRQERLKRIYHLLDICGLHRRSISKYPHEFSGGQRQRICIARALAPKPEFIVCDEPVSALDVSIQAQVINLLLDLQKEFGLTYLFISHDLNIVEYISTRVAVMYLGKIVEIAKSEDLYARALHPYTRALLDASPIPDPSQKNQNRLKLEGDIPSPIAPPPGCSFHPRCPIAQEICAQKEPCWVQEENHTTHGATCHFAGKKLSLSVSEPMSDLKKLSV